MTNARGASTDGTERSFEEIYADFAPRIRRYLARLTDDQQALDLCQEAFVRVHQGLAGFRGESSLSTWIYRIATNVALDRVRKAGIGSEELDDGAVADSAPPTDERAARSEMSECVREFVDRLPARYRAVLVLSDVEELSDREIADVIGTSVEAAKIRLHRARARLRAELQRGCVVSRDERNELYCEPDEPKP